jgi:hypothetical protein
VRNVRSVKSSLGLKKRSWRCSLQPGALSIYASFFFAFCIAGRLFACRLVTHGRSTSPEYREDTTGRRRGARAFQSIVFQQADREYLFCLVRMVRNYLIQRTPVRTCDTCAVSLTIFSKSITGEATIKAHLTS